MEWPWQRRRREDREDRAAFLSVISSIVASSASAAQANAAVLSKFLDGFDVQAAPELREWDEDASNARFLKGRGDLPTPLDGLSSAEAYSALVDKLNDFGF